MTNTLQAIKREWSAVFPLVAGLATAAAGFLQNQGGVKESVMGIAGLAPAAIGGASHQLKTGKITAASIHAAGSAVAQKLPSLEADLGNVASFVETEWPSTKQTIQGLEARVSAVESKAAAVPAVEQVVEAVRQSLLGTKPAA